MSVKASLSLGISVLVVSTKPGNAPRQAILKKKDFFLVMVGRHPEFLSRSGLKASPLALCLSLERWLELVTLQRRAMCAAGVEGEEEEGGRAAREGQGSARLFLSASSLKLILSSPC